jgi:2-polyprenyl-6-methoxyphenol hydroxylase-like FAD-dependent oxidoreductase
MEPGNVRIAIAGAGIGGLTAALALSQRGHRVEVFERAPALEPVGAGLTVQINAMRVLGRLGLGERIAARGATPAKAQVLDDKGKVISELELAALSAELGAPCVTVHRASLQALLLEALGEVPVRLGAEVLGFEQGAGEVSVRLADGSRPSFDALIGADGIHSAVRAQLHGKTAPHYAGQTCWRGICERGEITPPDLVTETWGKGSRFGLVPIGDGRLYWFAVADAPAGGKDGADVKAALLAQFGKWHREIPQAIEATPVERIFRADLYDRPVLARWGEACVSLLGDAAHPMTPNLGQGACMAIEDGWVLARALSEAATVEAALRRYEALRQERTAATVKLARRMGQLGQWSNGLARAVRDALVHATPRAVAERQVRWLFDFEV